MRWKWVASLMLLAALLSPAPGTAQAVEAVRFFQRATQLGDRVVQDVEFRLAMQMTYRQGQQVTAEHETELLRTQRRTVTVTEVKQGRATAARVTFDAANARVRTGEQPAQAHALSVEGKTYHVAREGESLRITDEGGLIPPYEEFAIVAEALDSLGRPNPLAMFLAGRTVRVGEKLELPKELAKMLFEGPDDVGEVTRFEMTLHELRQSGGQTCAVFKTQIEASSAATTQMTIHVGGTAVVETNTCRVVELRFSGPVALADTSGPVGARYFVNGRGKLHVAMTAKYDVGKRK